MAYGSSPGQGSNLCHSSNPRHCILNTIHHRTPGFYFILKNLDKKIYSLKINLEKKKKKKKTHKTPKFNILKTLSIIFQNFPFDRNWINIISCGRSSIFCIIRKR